MSDHFWGNLDELKNFCLTIGIENKNFEKLIGVNCISNIFSDKNHTLTFIKDKKFLDKAVSNENIAVIITNILDIDTRSQIILVDDPEFTYWSLFEYKQSLNKLTKPSYISPLAKIGKNVSISTTNVQISDGVKIGDNVTINSNCFIDINSNIGPNSVISSTGFLVKNTIYGKKIISHTGWAKIGKNVTTGALCTINQGLQEDTFIGDHTSIDCGVHIAHNCNIGTKNIITAHVTCGGSVNTGTEVFIGLGAILINRISIGSHSHIGAGCIVTRSYFEKVKLLGYPAKSVSF